MHNMIRIPGGLVSIGSPEHHLDLLPELHHFGRVWFEDEAPQHDRTIHTLWIDTHPVTNAQFAEFVAATDYVTAIEQRGYGLVYGLRYWQKEPGACWRRPGGATNSIAVRPDHPVVHVDHDDAARYARWAGKRLPTEAEWEYAAHGPRWVSWPWGKAWTADRANTAEHWAGRAVRESSDWQTWWLQHYRQYGSRPATTPVGRFSTAGDSPFGITDMAGNVAEWTASPYRPYAAG